MISRISASLRKRSEFDGPRVVEQTFHKGIELTPLEPGLDVGHVRGYSALIQSRIHQRSADLAWRGDRYGHNRAAKVHEISEPHVSQMPEQRKRIQFDCRSKPLPLDI